MRLRLGLVACLAALLLPAAKGQAVTVGAPLGVQANVNGSCQSLFLIPVPPSCTLLGLDMSGAWTSQTPRGSWVITLGRVRTGPAVGPMAFTVLRALRSQAGSPPSGVICCTASVESQVFTPAPNTVNEIPLNLPAVNTVEVIDGEPVEVVDYLAISVLNGASSLPLRQATSPADPAASASLSAFVSAVRQGQTQVQPGGPPQRMPLVNGEFEPAAAAPTAPGAVAPPGRFRLLPGARLLPGGAGARLGANLPGPGVLLAGPAGARAAAAGADGAAASQRSGKRRGQAKKRRPSLLLPARRRVQKAGKAQIVVRLSKVGKRVMARRGKLALPVRLTFRPDRGKAASRVRRVVFQKPRRKPKGKRAAMAAARPPAGPVTVRCAKFRQGLGKLSGAKRRAALRRFNTCVRQNKANRIAFNQIKDSKFAGVRGDGRGVESFFCASGRFESRISGSTGTGVSSGKRWWVKDARVRQGGKWIDAFLGAPGGYEIALTRRGAQWQYGVASLGRILSPGDVAKTRAPECARS